MTRPDFLSREPDITRAVDGDTVTTRLTETGEIRRALNSAFHANHVLTDAINRVVLGEHTVEQLRNWWLGPLVHGDQKEREE